MSHTGSSSAALGLLLPGDAPRPAVPPPFVGGLFLLSRVRPAPGLPTPPTPVGRAAVSLAFDPFRRKLVDDGVLFDSQCLISQTDEESFYPKSGTVFAIIFMDDFQATPPYYDGGGRAGGVESGRFFVSLIVRNFIDKVEEDQTVVLGTDPSVSLMALAQLVKESLHSYFPEDERGNALVLEPVRFSYQTKPKRLRRGREWTSMRVYFDVSLLNQYDYCTVP